MLMGRAGVSVGRVRVSIQLRHGSERVRVREGLR